ncbi:hypothetical protein LINGRAHAP2_LOCUS20304 [Linum grandiflorum]
MPTEFSPLATKLFYSNLRCSQTFPNTFTSIVLDEHIRFSPHVLSILLDIPMVGQVINEEADMWRLGFDGLGAFLELCPAFNPYFITRAILPRSFALDELLPLDILILWHTLHMKPLSLHICCCFTSTK